MTAVVTLPTAAAQPVRQRMTGARLQAYYELPNIAPKPEPTPHMKAYKEGCSRTAQLMLDSGDAAIMQLALAAFATAPAEQQAKMQGRLMALAALNKAGAAEALAWIEYEAATKDRKADIDHAGSLLAREDF
jgi:hypothetical protein